MLTVGKHGKSKGYSPPSPKGYPLTSPARPAGGRAVTSVTTRGPQARYPVRGTASPTQLHQRRESRGKNLFPLGFFPLFLPKKWGPGWASHRSLPFQRRAQRPTMAPAREGTVPARSNGAEKPPRNRKPPRDSPAAASSISLSLLIWTRLSRPRPSRSFFWRPARRWGRCPPDAPGQRGCSGRSCRPPPSSSARTPAPRTTWS